jgi:hypothetical protein
MSFKRETRRRCVACRLRLIATYDVDNPDREQEARLKEV